MTEAELRRLDERNIDYSDIPELGETLGKPPATRPADAGKPPAGKP